MTTLAVAHLERDTQVGAVDVAAAAPLAEHMAVLWARENSLPQTVALTESLEAKSAAADLSRHFDTDGLLLVRKALIARIEAWLGPGAQPRREPLSTAARVFDRWRLDADAPVGWRDRLLLAGLWVALVGRVFLKPFRRGMTLRRREYAIGVPNKWGPPRPGVAHHDLLAMDPERFKASDVVILAIDDAYVKEYRALGHPVLQVERAPVPLGIWVSDVLPRVARLAWRRRGVEARATGWLTSFAAWEVAWRSLHWEAISGTANIRVICDVEEQNLQHALKTAVFGRRGGKTVRVPFTQPDTPGNHTGFWMYHVVPIANAYLRRVYGASWWEKSIIERVGLIFNSDIPPEGPDTARRLAEIAACGPILSVFTGSDVGVQPRIHEAIVEVAARALRENPSLQVVIKPKPSHASFLDRSPIRERLAAFVAARRVTVLRPSDPTWCSAQALLRRSAACLTYGGSVVAEALALGTPTVVYPVVPGHSRSWLDAFRGTVVVESEEAAVALIADTLAGRGRAVDRNLVRDHCDAFLDQDALGRLRTLVAQMAVS